MVFQVQSTRWLVTLLLCLCFSATVRAQNQTVERNKAAARPISGRGLGTVSVGGIPVNLYTGSAAPAYPVCEVAGRDVSVPITLQYTAGNGVQVTSVASEVGTGWALNAGGNITCEVRGRPDEFDTTTKSWLSPVFTRETGAPLTRLQNNFCVGEDTEYDIYHLIAPGLQADFVMSGQYGSDNTNDIVVLNDRTVTITPTYWSNSRKIRTFTATDATGVQYSFEQAESSRVRTETRRLRDNNLSSQDDYTYVAKWYLSSIRSATGDVVTFTYQGYTAAPVRYKNYTHVVRAYEGCDVYGNNCTTYTTAPNTPENNRYETTTTITPVLAYSISYRAYANRSLGLVISRRR